MLVIWLFEVKFVGENIYDLVFKVNIVDGWKIYFFFQFYGDDVFGLVFIGIYFDEGDYFEIVGKLKEFDNCQEVFEFLFDNIMVAYFKKYVIFMQWVRVSDFGKFIIGYVECMVCDVEKCLLLFVEDFSFSLKFIVSVLVIVEFKFV